MGDHILRLDEICTVIADALRQANATPHQISWPADARQTALSYRIAGDAPGSRRSIPHGTLYRQYRYRVSEIAFSFPCCVSTRLQAGRRQTVLRLRLPAWWRRWGRRPPCRRIEIDVSSQGTRLRFLPGDLMQLPRKGADWIVLLTPEQQVMLAQSANAEPGPVAPGGEDISASGSKRKRTIAISARLRRWIAPWRYPRGDRHAN